MNLSLIKDWPARARRHRFKSRAVAEELKVSLRTMERFARVRFRISLEEWMVQLRSQCARELLLANELSVKEVAHAVGFADSSTFCRAFARGHGVSPRLFQVLVLC